MILAGDIGGTRTRLVAAQCDGEIPKIVEERIYASADFPDFNAAIKQFQKDIRLESFWSACFAVAGPVCAQSVDVTNLPWEISAQALKQDFSIEQVELINDFASIGHGIHILQDKDFCILQEGEAEKKGIACILGAGTGLGEAFITLDGDNYQVWSSEGGHADFAPTNANQRALLEYWQDKLERVSYENFLSGAGIGRIFEYYCSVVKLSNNDALLQKIKIYDPAEAISSAALDESNSVAIDTMKLFVRIYAAQAANLALTTNATAGVYIAGGIAPKIIELITNGEFMKTFLNKQPMNRLLEKMPVKVIMNPLVGLYGAVNRACQLLQS